MGKNNKPLTTAEFIRRAKLLHKDKYDYSKTEYVNYKTPVCIICPVHGEFWQIPSNHLMGRGCIKCGGKCRLDNEAFIERARKVHHNKYDYSRVEYTNNSTKICIVCPVHGEFWQIPNDHLRGEGCPKCANSKLRKMYSSTKDEFIEKARRIHGDKYDYSKVEYINSTTKINIICPEHGEFLCTPANHLRNRGCPVCSVSKHVYEQRIYDFLLTIFHTEDVVREYKNRDIFGMKSLDFYIPKYKLAIEHQGSQHFIPNEYYGGDGKFMKMCQNDIDKYNECVSNDITILYFSYERHTIPDNYFAKVYWDMNEFKNKILMVINRQKENEKSGNWN